MFKVYFLSNITYLLGEEVENSKTGCEKETVLVLLFPSKNVEVLRIYPIVFPLKRQTALRHEKNAAIQPKIKKVIFIELKKNMLIYVPPYWGVRLIFVPNNNHANKPSCGLSILHPFESNNTKIRNEVNFKLTTKYFQPGALNKQPMFFGMAIIAKYADTLFRFKNATERTLKKKSLFSLAGNRWNLLSNSLYPSFDYHDYEMKRGYVNDLTQEPNPVHAEMDNMVIAECKELMQIDKMSMVDQASVKSIMEEITVAAKSNRALLDSIVNGNKAVLNEMLLDHLEIILANTFGVGGVRGFLSCYFNSVEAPPETSSDS